MKMKLLRILYDMAGNVLEWYQDWYNDNQNTKVLRGGGWNYSGLPLRQLSR